MSTEFKKHKEPGKLSKKPVSRLERFDNLLMGINIGIVAPVIAGSLFYLVPEAQIAFKDFDDYIQAVSSHPHMLAKLISLSLMGNLVMFFLCLWGNIYRAARGVIFATLFYGAIIIILKLL